jgi:hypothetical protein
MYRWIKFFLAASAAALVIAQAPPARAQGTTGPAIRDSNVGYIDPAIPGNYWRLRFDAAYQNTRPTRAEFFWAPGPPNGGGPSIPERSVDYQDIQIYAERIFAPQTSGFLNIPVRFLNPELNPNTAGLVDINAGIKHALIYEEDLVTSLQFRVYAPSGDFHRGLGNSHVSLEPALLVYKPFLSGWTVEGELRDWIPVGGGTFAGNIISYGLGLHYDQLCLCNWNLVPIAEFIGWTALGGKVTAVDSSGVAAIGSASGDTIFNVKVGMRMKFTSAWDVYMGYGTPLTGDAWYQDTFRVELRLFR